MKSLLVILFITASLLDPAHGAIEKLPLLRASPNPMYTSEGFRLGHMASLSDKGFFWWKYRYEGKLLLGENSIAGAIYDQKCASGLVGESNQIRRIQADLADHPDRYSKDQIQDLDKKAQDLKDKMNNCFITRNPWAFSFFSEEFYNKFKTFSAGAILVYYKRPLVAPQDILTDTKTYLNGIWEVNPNIPLEPSMSAEGTSIFDKSNIAPVRGVMHGRIVGASVESTILKTYEVIIQDGESGNSFVKMSVSNDRLFDYIVKCMLSGRVLQIDYLKLTLVLRPLSEMRGYNTDYRVIKVTPI